MGKRSMTFEEKAARAKRSKFEKCIKCGGDMVPVKIVRAFKGTGSNSYKFEERVVKVCQCNEKEIYS